jgi:hypothetical protein
MTTLRDILTLTPRITSLFRSMTSIALSISEPDIFEFPPAAIPCPSRHSVEHDLFPDIYDIPPESLKSVGPEDPSMTVVTPWAGNECRIDSIVAYAWVNVDVDVDRPV